MIISDEAEAMMYGITASQRYINEADKDMFAKLRKLLDEQTPLHDVPARIKNMNDKVSPITNFNYENFYYL